MKLSVIKTLTAGIIFAASLTTQAATVPLDRVIAVVDDDVIMESELVSSARDIIRQLRANGTPLPPQEVLQEQILEKLILDQLQLDMAKRYGVEPPSQQINATIERIKQAKGLSDEQFMQQLAADGMTLKDLQQQIKRELTLKEVQRGNVSRRIRISEQEIDNFLESAEGKFWNSPDYHLGHILIPMSEGEEAARAKAESLYKQLQGGADFRQLAVSNSSGQFALKGGDLGWRKTAQLPGLFVAQLENLEKGQVTQPFKSGAGFHLLKLYDQRGGGEQLVQQTHVSHILIETSEIMSDQQAEAKLKRLRQQILDGADFAAVAKEHSDDIGSMLKGGDMGWANPGMFVPAFEQVMNDTAIGEISQPFKTQFGWHILKVLERRDEDMSDEMIRNQARQLLTSRRYEEELQSWLQEIRARAYVDIKI